MDIVNNYIYLAINYYSDESLSKYINMFGNHNSKL